MNGWNSQHSEFTPVKGNPEKIKYLISEFKLEGIVSFDEVNKNNNNYIYTQPIH